MPGSRRRRELREKGNSHMTEKPRLLEDVKVVVEEGDGGYRLIAEEEGGPRVLAEGLPQDYAERIAVIWNFCEGFGTASFGRATLHMLMDAME